MIYIISVFEMNAIGKRAAPSTAIVGFIENDAVTRDHSGYISSSSPHLRESSRNHCKKSPSLSCVNMYCVNNCRWT